MSGYDTRRKAKSPEALRHLLATERDWEAYLSGTSDNVPPLNPYRQDSEGTEAGA